MAQLWVSTWKMADDKKIRIGIHVQKRFGNWRGLITAVLAITLLTLNFSIASFASEHGRSQDLAEAISIGLDGNTEDEPHLYCDAPACESVSCLVDISASGPLLFVAFKGQLFLLTPMIGV